MSAETTAKHETTYPVWTARQGSSLWTAPRGTPGAASSIFDKSYLVYSLGVSRYYDGTINCYVQVGNGSQDRQKGKYTNQRGWIAKLPKRTGFL